MRYVIKARGINVFKNGRSFSNINYAKRKLLEVSEILDEDFSIEEIEDEKEILKAQIEKLKDLVMRVKPYIEEISGDAYGIGDYFPNHQQWIKEAREILK